MIMHSIVNKFAYIFYDNFIAQFKGVYIKVTVEILIYGSPVYVYLNKSNKKKEMFVLLLP